MQNEKHIFHLLFNLKPEIKIENKTANGAVKLKNENFLIFFVFN